MSRMCKKRMVLYWQTSIIVGYTIVCFIVFKQIFSFLPNIILIDLKTIDIIYISNRTQVFI